MEGEREKGNSELVSIFKCGGVVSWMTWLEQEGVD